MMLPMTEMLNPSFIRNSMFTTKTSRYNFIFASFNYASSFKSSINWLWNSIFRPIYYSSNSYIMMFRMFRLRRYFKITNTIISLNSILVMNNFIWEWLQLPTNVFFHYITMLKNSFLTNVYSSVSVLSNRTFSHRDVKTLPTTHLYSFVVSLEIFSTLGTFFNHKLSISYGGI